MKITLFFILLLSHLFAHSEVEYCSGVKMSGEKISFSDTEQRLFCGDPDSHAWKKIPPYQAELFLRGFLQSRGYLTPEFAVEDGVLHVKPGRKSEVKNIVVRPLDEKLSSKIKKDVNRLYEEKLLTPAMLNSIEGEGMAQLRRRGYPCGKISSHVDVTEDTVTLLQDKKKKHDFGVIKREPIDGLHENALLRFYPMDPDDRFDGELLTLTEKRMLRAEVVQATYFLESCTDEGENFSLEQRFITGPPRSLRFGGGASTESGPMARIRWSNNRAGKMASLLSATLEASFRIQSLNLSADYFAWTDAPRRSLLTQFEVTRESQFDYEQLLTRLRPQMKWLQDDRSHQVVWIAGPAFENGTYSSGEKSSRTFSNAVLEGSFQRTSHQYELFDVHPQEGDQLGVTVSYRSPLLGFSDSLTRFDTTMVKLGRLTTSGRGSLIGGVRLKAGTAFIDSTTDTVGLPPEVKFFGGGSDDIRGYLLRTLPNNDGVGALSRMVLKFELRQTHLFHESVEGFAFTDGGRFGEEAFSLDRRIWWSPGVGVRWLSPIGVVQGYWARAFVTSPTEDRGDFFFAGLGGTF